MLKNVTTSLLLFLPLLAITSCSLPQNMPNSNGNNQSVSGSESSAPLTSTFSYNESKNDYTGELQLKGYPRMETRNEAFCEENCETYQYVMLQITNGITQELTTYLNQNQGNSFVAQRGLGLGCLDTEQNQLYWQNTGTGGDLLTHRLSTASSNELLNATEANPIRITLIRNNVPLGQGAPTCYSHFNEINIMEQMSS